MAHVYFATPTTTANYELRLYEGQSHFDVVWGAVASGNTSATGGVQKSTDFDQVLLQRLGWCDDGRTKLHPAKLQPVTDAYS